MQINIRTSLAFAHDVVASMLAWVLAYLLRFNFDMPDRFLQEMWHMLVLIVPAQAIVFWYFGLYRGIWRYASLPDLKRIVVAIVVAAMVAPLLLLLFRVDAVLPRSVLVLNPILLLLLMGGSRLVYRSWKEHRLYGLTNLQAEPVLVLGAGDAAVTLVKELERSHEWRVVGLLDDNPKKGGRQIQGVKVLGKLDELPAWATHFGAQNAIIAMPSVAHDVRKRAVEICAAAGIKVMTVPSFNDLMSGKVTVSQIRRVELDDLLGRDPVVLDDEGLQDLLSNHVVMVSGAGGSIGSELCRQIAKFKPRLLVMLELNELALYRIEQEFGEQFPEISVVCAVGDVKNRARLDQLLGKYSPSVIFHAAAYKHVPLMEVENAWEAIQNNVLGTCTLAEAAIAHGVAKFVLISTDKAVNPTNVMGASKRLAEMVCQGLQQPAGTRFVMVRFGNVLGSTGSVIPKFHEQIARGGPVTVTHPEITRYFMSIPEAAQLVLQAGLMGKGGEIFVMEMGEPVRIADLARQMIRLSGFGEDEIRVEYTGLRPGEKLYEELLADDEHTLPTPHPKLRIAQARQADGEWLKQLCDWLNASAMPGDAEVKRVLKVWVPEYANEEGKN
jgi:FlaA1/EpsC-like NDP-sugar epimerase